MLVHKLLRGNTGHRTRWHLEALSMIIANKVHIPGFRIRFRDNPQFSFDDDLLAPFALGSSGLGVLDFVS